MDITLEMIDEVRSRSGVSYREACEALDAANGSVVEALAVLEEGRGDTREILKKNVKEVYRRCKEARVEINVGDNNSLKIPLVWGALGAAVFPKYTALGVLGLMLAQGALQVKNNPDTGEDEGENEKDDAAPLATGQAGNIIEGE